MSHAIQAVDRRVVCKEANDEPLGKQECRHKERGIDRQRLENHRRPLRGNQRRLQGSSGSIGLLRPPFIQSILHFVPETPLFPLFTIALSD